MSALWSRFVLTNFLLSLRAGLAEMVRSRHWSQSDVQTYRGLKMAV